jgi:CMP-2-keto-3-deoxyoctulosonic acid synthetase
MTPKTPHPDGTERVKQELEKFGEALPSQVAIIILQDNVGINDPDEIHTVIKHLRDHDEDVRVIEDAGTVADRAWTNVLLEWDG